MITKRRQRRKRMQILSQYGLSDTSPEHVPLSEQTPFVVRSAIRLLQLNVEGITKAETSIIKHLADTHDATAILLLQLVEPHIKVVNERYEIPFNLKTDVVCTLLIRLLELWNVQSHYGAKQLKIRS